MSYSDLLLRMKMHDADAFLDMTNSYGWSLYSYIRKKYPDKRQADKVYQETMQRFWFCLQSDEFEDPMEALLCAFSDQISVDVEREAAVHETQTTNLEENPPAVRIASSIQKKNDAPKQHSNLLGSILLSFMMLLIFIFCVWIILGFLMEYGVISYMDLGYTWLCNLLEQLLLSLNVY